MSSIASDVKKFSPRTRGLIEMETVASKLCQIYLAAYNRFPDKEMELLLRKQRELTGLLSTMVDASMQRDRETPA